MAVTVTLRVFSGRSNPSWTIVDRDIIGELAEHLNRRLTALERPPSSMCCSCYRGYELRGEGEAPILDEAYINAGATGLHSGGRTLEHRLLGYAPSDQVSDWLKAYVAEGIECSANCPPAPPPRSGEWSTTLRKTNNCYNYATNVKAGRGTGHPGAGGGAPVAAADCGNASALAKGALADGLTEDAWRAEDEIKVALFVWEKGIDFHWYRLHSNGLWSHKYGADVALDHDGAGILIEDPRCATRLCYDKFGGFFFASESRVRVKGLTG